MAVDRRDFLKAASMSLAAGAAAFPDTVSGQNQRPTAVTISGTHYQHRPGRDYPIRAKGFADVRLTDGFRKPKVDLNAAVTIPDLGRQHFDDKDFPRRVRAVRAF